MRALKGDFYIARVRDLALVRRYDTINVHGPIVDDDSIKFSGTNRK